VEGGNIMITLKEYQTIERFNICEGFGLNKYDYDFNIYSIKSYKLFGIITLFKSKKLIKTGRDDQYGKPQKKERY
jgi:hypothetical protein